MAVISIQCKSADDIIDCLDINHFIWREKGLKRWIFRGQRDHRWKLSPPAFRSGAVLDYDQKKQNTPSPSVEEQSRLEFNALFQFLNLSHEAGLPLPEDCETFTDYRKASREVKPTFRNGTWPPSFLMAALARAQHHDIATRFLAFSYKPLFALFFAARDAVENGETGSQLAVWGLDLDFLYTINKRIYSRFEFVTLVDDDNNSYDNQEGVFLLDRNANQAWPRQRPDLDRVVSELHDQHSDSPVYTESIPPLYKLIVPVKEAREILKKLEKLNITGAHLSRESGQITQWLKFKRQFL